MPGLAGSLLTWMLFRSRLVPRLISVVGLIGYALVLLGGIAGWFDLVDVSPGGNATLLAVPVALFAIVLSPSGCFSRASGYQKQPQPKYQERAPAARLLSHSPEVGEIPDLTGGPEVAAAHFTHQARSQRARGLPRVWTALPGLRAADAFSLPGTDPHATADRRCRTRSVAPGRTPWR